MLENNSRQEYQISSLSFFYPRNLQTGGSTGNFIRELNTGKEMGNYGWISAVNFLLSCDDLGFSGFLTIAGARLLENLPVKKEI